MSGAGRTIISAGAACIWQLERIDSKPPGARKTGAPILWTGAGDIGLTGTVITNRAGALFEAQNAPAQLPVGRRLTVTIRERSASPPMPGL